jgi:hypothetical protein
MVKILISTSLFYYNTSSSKYNKLYKNIINTLNILNEYNVDVVIYHDNTVPKNIIDDLKKYEHVILVEKEKSNNREGCFWRYEAYDDFKEYNIYMFRDIDISLEINDLYSINKFLESDRKIYPKQGFLMGGMFGMKRCIYSLKDLIKTYKQEKKLNFYGSDEEFLAKKLYPLEKALVFIEPKVKNAVLTSKFFNKLNLDDNYEIYIHFKNNYKLI